MSGAASGPRRWSPATRAARASALVALVALSGGALRAAELDPALDAQLEGAELRVFPERIQLDDARDRTAVVVQAVLPDGRTRDLSGVARLALDDPSVAALASGVVVPRADGTTLLRISVGRRAVEVPVEVRGAAAPRPLSFRNDCLPVLTRSGCNTGSCHGSSRGKDGFRLSLFGFDPAGDYERLTREQAGRRVDLAAPARSLLLDKATNAVRHGGGRRFAAEGPEYATLLEWLAAGAPPDPATLPTLTGLELSPPSAVLLAGEGQRLLVRARYSDGSDRDVTALAALSSSDPLVAALVAGDRGDGALRAAGRGEAQLMARFGDRVVGAQVLVVPAEADPWPEDEPEDHAVDALVNRKLRALRVRPAPVCDDATYLRRVTLDITGTLPTPDEVRAFLADPAPDKRARRVDALLARPEFAQLWVMLWAERLQIRTVDNRVSTKAMLAYARWLEDRIAQNVPVDVWVRELLTATGSVFANPATNLYQAEPDDKRQAEDVAQVFLGMRIQCAQCHNHPFDRWTQDDYYGWAALFAQVGRKRGADPRETVVFDKRGGEIKHPVTGQPVAPKFLGGEAPSTKGKDRRDLAAAWITAPDNPYFARNLTNWVWAWFFGRGIVHEPDDVRVSNPPSNPALLDALAARFVASRYDLAALVRDLCTSRAYQRAASDLPDDAPGARDFARATVRPLRAEVLLDALSQATDAPSDFRGLPAGARAVQLADGAYDDYFLTTFGRSRRESPCTCAVKAEPNLGQALHLLTGETVTKKVRQGKLVERLLAAGRTPDEVRDELYLRCFGRPPTEAERAALTPLLAAGKPQRALEDLLWALLNAREFSFQH